MKHYSLLVAALLLLAPLCLPSTVRAQDGAKKDQAKTIDPKMLEKAAKAFGEWIQLKDTSNLKELKKLKKVEPDLQEQLDALKKAGHDWLKDPSILRQLLTHEKFSKFGRSQSGKKGFPISKDDKVDYSIKTPSGYRPRTPMGMVLCLHPLGGDWKFSGNDYLRSMYAEKQLHGKVIHFAPEAPKPKKPKKGEEPPPPFEWSNRESLVYTLGSLSHARGDTMDGALNLNTDHNRLFLDGYGSGGTSAWKIASGFASLFAGVVIRGAMPPEGTRFEDFKNTPFLLYGLAGEEMDPGKADEVAAKMKAAGVDVTVVKINEFKRRQEKKAFKATPPEVLAFFDKARNPYPTKIDWSIKETHTRQSFWVKSLNEIEDETLPEKKRGKVPSFQVSVDRAKNRIAITSHRIEKFLIYLNDSLVDLDKPVTIEVNKKVVFNGKKDRTRDELIDNWEIFGDQNASYPSSVEVEVPVDPEDAKKADEEKKDGKDAAQPSVKGDE